MLHGAGVFFLKIVQYELLVGDVDLAPVDFDSPLSRLLIQEFQVFQHKKKTSLNLFIHLSTLNTLWLSRGQIMSERYLEAIILLNNSCRRPF